MEFRTNIYDRNRLIRITNLTESRQTCDIMVKFEIAHEPILGKTIVIHRSADVVSSKTVSAICSDDVPGSYMKYFLSDRSLQLHAVTVIFDIYGGGPSVEMDSFHSLELRS